MERELAKLVKDAAKSAGDMEKSFNQANINIGKGANVAFGKLPQQANQAGTAIKNTSGYTANLASQLNDIGVQLAGGQSPFLIMLQQGTQINQLFTQTGGSVRGFGSILAGAVTSVLSPFSLLTFAIIGAGGYAAQYFGDLLSGGEQSNKVLKEQEGIIRSVAEKWGESIPALKEYVDNLDRLKAASDLQTTGKAAAATQWDVIREAVAAFEKEQSRVVGTLTVVSNTVGGQNAELKSLADAWNDFRQKTADGTATMEDFDKVRAAATTAAATTGVDQLNTFAASLGDLSTAVDGPLAKLRELLPLLNATAGQQRMLDPNTWRGKGNAAGAMYGDQRPIQGSSDPDLPMSGPVPDSRPSDLGTPKSRGYSAPKGGSKRGGNAYKDEIASIKERTASLKESTAAQAAVNPLVNDYGFALAKAQAEQRLLADAQRAGLAITPQLRDQISTLATDYANASAAAKKLAEEQNNVRKRAEEWADLEKDTFKGFISDLKAGKSGAEALSNALDKVADKFLDMAFDGIFSTKSGGGSGLFGSLFSGIGKLFGVGFASGTANTGGKRGQPAGVVHGQEAVIPLPSGGKVPVQINSPSMGDLSKKASRDVVDINLVDDSGRMAEIANQQIRTASGTIVSVSVKQAYNQVKGNMASLITDTQQRSL